MKKLFLSILVICSLLGGNAYAESLKFKCSNGYDEMKIYEWKILNLDLKNKEFSETLKSKYGTPNASWKSSQIWIDQKKIIHKPYALHNLRYMFDYSSYPFEYYQVTSFNGTPMKKLLFDQCKEDTVTAEELNLSGENQITEVNKDNRMSVSKKTCLELGFTSATEKFGDCVLKIMSMNNLESDSKKNVAVPTSTTTQDQQYASTPKFTNVIKDKFYHKQFKRFMKTPEAELCISYINAYGWHKREKKQAIKYEVLETRNINCDRYMEAAYYDKKERDGEMQDAVKKVFDSGVDAAYGVDTNASKKSKQRCIVQKVGKNMYTQTCR